MPNLRPEYITIGVTVALEIVIVYFWWKHLTRLFKSQFRAYDTLVFTTIFIVCMAIFIYIFGNKLDLNYDLLIWISLMPLLTVLGLQFVIYNLEVEATNLLAKPLASIIAGICFALPLLVNVVITDIINPDKKVLPTDVVVILTGALIVNLIINILFIWKWARWTIIDLGLILVAGIFVPVYSYLIGHIRIAEMIFWAVMFLLLYLLITWPVLITTARRKAEQQRNLPRNL